MKSERGITLTALVIYIGVATIVISMVAMVSSFFFSNIKLIKEQERYAIEFNKFNMFFINDIKSNQKAQVSSTQIILEDGTTYSYSANEKAIYRGETKIAKQIEEAHFSQKTYQVPNTKTTKILINVQMKIGKEKQFEKTIEYVLKYW